MARVAAFLNSDPDPGYDFEPGRVPPDYFADRMSTDRSSETSSRG